jgi:hypothetical protein
MNSFEEEQRQPQPDTASEAELRAAYEEELKRIRVEHVMLENVVTLVSLGMRRTGLAPGTEGERDAEQVRLAIEGIRAQLPLIEQAAPAQAAQVRGALSQLQLAFVKIGGAPAPPGRESAGAPGTPGAPQSEPRPPTPGEPGPAQRSGKLWIPGQ